MCKVNLLVGLLVSVFMLGCALPMGAARMAPNEALLAAPRDGNAVTLRLSQKQSIPEAVRADVSRLEAVLAELELSPFHSGLRTSADGRAMLAYDGDRRSLWVWDSWREPEAFVHYPCSWGAFAGGGFLRCMSASLIRLHDGREWALPAEVGGSPVMDVSVDDAGAYWALTTEDGRMLLGGFDDESEVLRPDRVISLEDEPYRGAMTFVRGRQILVVNSDEQLLAVNAATGSVEEVGVFGRGYTKRAGDGCVTIANKMIEFGETINERRVHHLPLRARAFIRHVSPSGDFVMTSREEFVFIKSYMHRTPRAEADVATPTIPGHDMTIRGWLAWD